MRIVLSGPTLCSTNTFKRLLLVAEELAFIDRALTTGQSVVTDSVLSDLARAFKNGPVEVTVHKPPEWSPMDLEDPFAQLDRAYWDQDLGNFQFRRIVLQGMARSEEFRRKLLDLDFVYDQNRTGRQVLQWISEDSSMASALLGPESWRGLLY
jgi:hypothetical protein